MRTFIIVIAFFSNLSIAALVANSYGGNQALIVGVDHGLPGIEIDVDNMADIARNDANNYSVMRLLNEDAEADSILYQLEDLSHSTGKYGTFMFYFSGHGNQSIISTEDYSLSIQDIRYAIAKGREGLGPLTRLVLIFDSCNSGSMLGPIPFFRGDESMLLANNIIQLFLLPQSDSEPSWNQIFIFSSSQANESSIATAKGSLFTLAFKQAFDESLMRDLNMGQFVDRTKGYTKSHHPVERLIPETMRDESMRSPTFKYRF